MPDNIIRPISADLVEKLPEKKSRLINGSLSDSSGYNDAIRLLSDAVLGEHKIKSIDFGGNMFGHSVVQITVSVLVKIPRIWLTKNGLEVLEEPTPKEVLIDFYGDGIIYVYFGVQDDTYYLEVNFDDHNWKIEHKSYALMDMLNTAIGEYNKFPVK